MKFEFPSIKCAGVRTGDIDASSARGVQKSIVCFNARVGVLVDA